MKQYGRNLYSGVHMPALTALSKGVFFVNWLFEYNYAVRSLSVAEMSMFCNSTLSFRTCMLRLRSASVCFSGTCCLRRYMVLNYAHCLY